MAYEWREKKLFLDALFEQYKGTFSFDLAYSIEYVKHILTISISITAALLGFITKEGNLQQASVWFWMFGSIFILSFFALLYIVLFCVLNNSLAQNAEYRKQLNIIYGIEKGDIPTIQRKKEKYFAEIQRKTVWISRLFITQIVFAMFTCILFFLPLEKTNNCNNMKPKKALKYIRQMESLYRIKCNIC